MRKNSKTQVYETQPPIFECWNKYEQTGKVHRKQSVLNMFKQCFVRRDTILKTFIEFAVLKSTRKNTHKHRKPLLS